MRSAGDGHRRVGRGATRQWPFSLGWLGTYLLYPAWSLSFGRLLASQ